MEQARFKEILAAGRLPVPTYGPVEITGADPIIASPFYAGEIAAVALGLTGVSAASFWHMRKGEEQQVSVDVSEAAATLISFMFQRVGSEIDIRRHFPATTELYETADNRWIHLHGGFPHLASGLYRLLGCPENADRDELAKMVHRWNALELEDAIADAGLCGTIVRTSDEWVDHAQGKAIADLPVVEILKIGDAPPIPLPDGPNPLSDIRVLDLTRVLAGPACGRTLASYGADVLRIGAERLPSIEPFVIDTGPGKRNAFLDLDVPDDVKQLHHLIRHADLFCQSYRYGSLAARGFSPEDTAALCPGIIYVSMNCYGHVGPWATRPGWEQLAQSVVGLATPLTNGEKPQLIPAAATDYTTGYLAAYGAMIALSRRAVEGGSWLVRTSLCQTGMWLTRLGATCDPETATGFGDLSLPLTECDTHWGRLTHLAPVVRMSSTPPSWACPPTPLGTHDAEW